MGFGTLFFGYFLLLNITYYSFTDIIAALVMAMAFNKLSSVNRPFKCAFYSSVIFAVIGLFELCVQLYAMFVPYFSEATLMSAVVISRCIIIAVVTVFMLKGIENVSYEVGLADIAKKAHVKTLFTLIIYFGFSVLEIPNLETIIDIKIIVITGTVFLLLTFFLIIANLITIYSAYMHICMPDDKDNDIRNAPSKFEFVNKYRERNAEKQREYMEYKLEKLKKKNQKQNDNKKKK